MGSFLKIFSVAAVSFILIVFSSSGIAQGDDLGLKGPSEEIKGVPKPEGSGGLVSVIVRIIDYALYLIGTIAVAALIWGGFVYITSAGNEEAIKKAKTIITYAIIGLFVAILAWVIVYAIITEIWSIPKDTPDTPKDTPNEILTPE